MIVKFVKKHLKRSQRNYSLFLFAYYFYFIRDLNIRNGEYSTHIALTFYLENVPHALKVFLYKKSLIISSLHNNAGI